MTHSLNVYTADEEPTASAGDDHNGRSYSGLAYSALYRMNAQHIPFYGSQYRMLSTIANPPSSSIPKEVERYNPPLWVGSGRSLTI